jgi:Ca-activated chloride channel family protein
VLSEIRLELAGIDVNRTYPRDLPDLFHGGQLVWVGRYRQSGRTTIRMSGKIGSERMNLEFPAELAEPGVSTGHDYVETLWAVRRLGDLIDQIDMRGQNPELTQELVALSTKYGILTPYTSFLADERTRLHAFRENTDRAAVSLESLSEVDGRLGVLQRAVKQDFMKSENAARYGFGLDGGGSGAKAQNGPAGPRTAARSAGSTGRMQSDMKRLRGSLSGMAGGMARLSRAGAADAEGMLGEAEGMVRKLGAKTFYWKNERWVDSTVTDEEDAKATKLTQFSDDYFRLARTQKSEYNQYLSMEEPVTVKLDGKVYHIEPSKDQPAK